MDEVSKDVEYCTEHKARRTEGTKYVFSERKDSCREECITDWTISVMFSDVETCETSQKMGMKIRQT
jgi:hypothetical protein